MSKSENGTRGAAANLCQKENGLMPENKRALESELASKRFGESIAWLAYALQEERDSSDGTTPDSLEAERYLQERSENAQVT